MRERKVFAVAAMLFGLAAATAPAAASEQSGAQATDTGTRVVRVITGQGKDKCPADKLCLYELAAFNMAKPGRILVTDEDINDLSKYNFDKQTTSLFNNRDRQVRVCNSFYCDGDTMDIPKDYSVDWAGTPFDKWISALRFFPK
ncbi:peptidase inhibitor family I36 protein [Saccharopolyspora spinosa]|uniref:Peptidase inhibitor family I36 n=1 Tax=Saccharopolyspora spinosa TaxID=60894 RepID=A0A2N3Y6G9_SACSN|nr:peptidase inhibitor family I36 protein [Saccharopolyspora spinosa]PKW18542.1 peptidase inhibitor family I36 [Saccharopolyspora spinosa]